MGVDEVKNPVGLIVQIRTGPEQTAGHGHHHGRGGTVAFGISYQQAAAVLRQFDNVIVISAGVATGFVMHSQFKAADLG